MAHVAATGRMRLARSLTIGGFLIAAVWFVAAIALIPDSRDVGRGESALWDRSQPGQEGVEDRAAELS